MLCSLCRAKEAPFAIVEKTEFGKFRTRNYLKCTSCGSVWQKNPEQDYSIYDQAYFDKFLEFSRTEESNRLCEARIDFFKGFLSQPPKQIVDFGCGAGDFLHNAGKYFGAVHPIGVDINLHAKEYMEKYFPEVIYFKTIVHLLECFNDHKHVDLITAYDSIEHLTHPLRLAAIASDVLEEGGLFVISTPYLPDGKFAVDHVDHGFGVNACEFASWRHVRPAEHFVHGTISGFKTMMENVGLEFVGFGFPEDEIKKPGPDTFHGKNIVTVAGRKPCRSL